MGKGGRGTTFVRNDFYRSVADEPHVGRRKAILKAHPEIETLFVPDSRPVPYVIAMVFSQMFLAYLANYMDPDLIKVLVSPMKGAEIFGEVNRLRSEAPSEAELGRIKSNMAGLFTIQNSSRFGVIGQLQFVDQYGLDTVHAEPPSSSDSRWPTPFSATRAADCSAHNAS